MDFRKGHTGRYCATCRGGSVIINDVAEISAIMERMEIPFTFSTQTDASFSCCFPNYFDAPTENLVAGCRRLGAALVAAAVRGLNATDTLTKTVMPFSSCYAPAGGRLPIRPRELDGMGTQ